LGVLFVMLLLLAGCVYQSKDGNEEAPAQSPAADCVINGRGFYFVKDEVRQTWTEPLAKLLSNVRVPYGDGRGDILGYQASMDPHAPVIPQSYSCGLLDVTGDGIPELLVFPEGFTGSSGTATYYVYNFYSGQKLGSIEGGMGQSICFYYNTASDDLDLVGEYWIQSGWSWRGRFTDKIYYDDMLMECWSSNYLFIEHDIDNEKIDVVEEASDELSGTEAWLEIYPNTEYYVNGSAVSLDKYYSEYERFVRESIRIPETELILFAWRDVADSEDDYAVRGRKMAEALVNSRQEFLLP